MGRNTRNYFVTDFGASNGRCSVFRYDGKGFVLEEVYRFENRPVNVSGTLYWDILRLYSELKIGLQKAFSHYRELSGIAVDTWSADFAFVDTQGRLIANPVHYRDEKRSAVAEDFFKKMPAEEIFRLTGASVIPSQSLFHMYSLVKEGTLEINNASKFLMMPDLFHYFLTGESYNDFTNVTSTLMYNQRQKCWEDKILSAVGISKKLFSEILEPGQLLGKLRKEVAAELDIPILQVINPATWDSSSALVGIPVQEFHSEWAYLSLGTWGVFGIENDQPLITDEAFRAGFGNIGHPEEKNNFCKDSMGFWIIQQCLKYWLTEHPNKVSWDEIIRLAELAHPFTNFIDVEDPAFSLPQINMPEAVARYCRYKNQPVPQGIGAVSRCVYENLVLKFREHKEYLEKLIGKSIEIIYLVGGGAKNTMLCQWTADATGVQVSAIEEETTSVGNFLMQLKATGEIRNQKEGREIAARSVTRREYWPRRQAEWEEAYEKYRQIFGK